MVEPNDWIPELRAIIDQMVDSDVHELELRRGDLRIRLRRKPGAPTANPAEAGSSIADKELQEAQPVTAPLTGVFYLSPSPNARAYVEVGDWVEPDTVVGLIEAMKVFNEVSAECRGRVVALQARQGQLVHAGETVLLVDTDAPPDNAGRTEA